MNDYPEHEKLRTNAGVESIADLSQVIGEFLDCGIPRMGLAIYQKITRPCEANHRCAVSAWHSEEELATMIDRRVQITEWVPMHRTIQSVLAEYFGIDQAKIDAEKEAMLDALRAANAR